jgi:hypothetical protein
MKINRIIRFTWGVTSVLVTSAVVGAGLGFFQGEILTRTWSRPEQIAFAEGAAFLGTIVALFAGPLLYAFLRRRISIGELCGIIACSAIGGGLVALARWEVLVPVASVFVCAGAAVTVKALREDH